MLIPFLAHEDGVSSVDRLSNIDEPLKEFDAFNEGGPLVLGTRESERYNASDPTDLITEPTSRGQRVKNRIRDRHARWWHAHKAKMDKLLKKKQEEAWKAAAKKLADARKKQQGGGASKEGSRKRKDRDDDPKPGHSMSKRSRPL